MNQEHKDMDVSALITETGVLDITRDPLFEERVIEKIEHQIDWSISNPHLGEPTGFAKLDHITEGFQKSSIWMIGGATSSGKSQFALSLIVNLMRRQQQVVLFSLEMPAYQNYYRIASCLSEKGYKINDIRKNRIPNVDTKVVMRNVITKAKSYLEIIENTNKFDLIKLYIKDRASQGVKYFFLDYVQLINGGLNDHKDISVIAAEIQGLSKELDVCIVLVSQVTKAKTNDQFSSALETADFKGSGDWENVAGVSLVITHELNQSQRAEVSDLVYKMGGHKEFPMKISVTKNRDGNGTGMVKFKSIPECSRFIEISDEEYNSLKNQSLELFAARLKETADEDA